MGADTAIEWCHATFNPWIGCTKVSPGCAHCYAEVQDKRWGHARWGKGARRTRTSPTYWRGPARWAQAAHDAGERRRVFCASLADVFDDEVPIEWREELWMQIAGTPELDWLLLTKRPENIERMLPPASLRPWGLKGWANVWLGTSAEDQQRLEERLRPLMRVPARVHFLSYEPALGPLDLYFLEAAALDWVIVGGESGPGARPFDIAWARSVIDWSRELGIACFVKQLGAVPMMNEQAWRAGPGLLLSAHNKDRVPDGSVPLSFMHRKAGEMFEWPVDLRVREFPQRPAVIP